MEKVNSSFFTKKYDIFRVLLEKLFRKIIHNNLQIGQPQKFNGGSRIEYSV